LFHCGPVDIINGLYKFHEPGNGPLCCQGKGGWYQKGSGCPYKHSEEAIPLRSINDNIYRPYLRNDPGAGPNAPFQQIVRPGYNFELHKGLGYDSYDPPAGGPNRFSLRIIPGILPVEVSSYSSPEGKIWLCPGRQAIQENHTWGTIPGFHCPGFMDPFSEQAGADNFVSDYLESNLLDLDEKKEIFLSFDYIFKQKEEGVDQLILMYRIFEDNKWVSFAELESTVSLDNWTNYECKLPDSAMTDNVQLAFYYTDKGETCHGAGIDNIRINTYSSDIESIYGEHNIVVYPNPASGIINISGLIQAVDVEVYSIQGQLLKSAVQVQNTVDISNLPAGVYFLNLTKGDRTVVKKIVVKK